MKKKKVVKKKQNNLKWFEFDQNNSGGSFTVDDKLCHRIYIQAKTQDEALEKGLEMGIYLYGVEDERDCSCCGDRWYSPHEVDYKRSVYYLNEYLSYQTEDLARHNLQEKIKKTKAIRGVTVGPIKKDTKFTSQLVANLSFANIQALAQYEANEYGWTKPDCRMYYANGTVKEIFSNKG